MTSTGVWEILIETHSSLHEQVMAWLESRGLTPVERLLTTKESAADDDWKEAGLCVYFGSSEETPRLAAELAAFGAELSVTTRFLSEASWQGVWDESIESFATERFVVGSAPSQEHAEKIVIQLSPSEAFGDGKHVTTRLTLAFLDTLLQDHLPHSVLDVGCGNGVLAIAAALCGVPRVVATDVMEDAVTVTNRNASLNGVTIDARLDARPFDGRTFEWVVANIPAAALAAIMNELKCSLASGGRLILAGFFVGDAPLVVQAAAEEGLTLETSREESGWAVLSFRARDEA